MLKPREGPRTAPPALKSAEDDYVRKCLEPHFREETEDREFWRDPEAQRILGPLNAGRNDEAAREAETMVARYTDLDLCYKWGGTAALRLGAYDRARTFLRQGLEKAKRKSSLCTGLGEVEWKLRNIKDCLYWWTQAIHCQESIKVYSDESAFLYLYYVAEGLGLADVAAAFISRVDKIRPGQVRLDPPSAADLRNLAGNQTSPGMAVILKKLRDRYLTSLKAPAAAAPEPGLASPTVPAPFARPPIAHTVEVEEEENIWEYLGRSSEAAGTAPLSSASPTSQSSMQGPVLVRELSLHPGPTEETFTKALSPIWKFDLKSSVLKYVCDAHRLFVATNDGVVRAIDGESGNVLWQAQIAGAASYIAVLAVVNGRLFVGTNRGVFSAFGAESGVVIWENQNDAADSGVNAWPSMQMIACPETLVVAAAVEGRYSRWLGLRAETGESLWSAVSESVPAFLTCRAGRNLCRCLKTSVRWNDPWAGLDAIDSDSGKILWSMPQKPENVTALVSTDRLIWSAQTVRGEVHKWLDKSGRMRLIEVDSDFRNPRVLNERSRFNGPGSPYDYVEAIEQIALVGDHVYAALSVGILPSSMSGGSALACVNSSLDEVLWARSVPGALRYLGCLTDPNVVWSVNTVGVAAIEDSSGRPIIEKSAADLLGTPRCHIGKCWVVRDAHLLLLMGLGGDNDPQEQHIVLIDGRTGERILATRIGHLRLVDAPA